MVFDAQTVTDQFTYAKPSVPSIGFKHVLVNGVPVVTDGTIRENTFPGRGARAPQH